MKRISSLLALGFLSLGFATSTLAQTKVTQLVIQNSTGTTKLSQTSGGLDVDNKVVLHSTVTPANTVTLMVPSTSGMGNANFTFPTSGGTLLTTTADQTNGDAIVAAINAAANTSKITATHLDLTGVSLGVSTVAAGDLTLNINTLAGNVTATLNLNNANTWTATQTFPVTLNQGNALINSINAGNIALSGYVTNSSLATTLSGYVTNSYLTSNYTTTTDMNTAITNAITNNLPVVNAAPGSYTNANITVDAQGRVTAASNGSAGGGTTLTRANVNASSAQNNDLTLGSASYFRITASGSGGFGFRSITAGTDGQIIVLQNVSGQNMSVNNGGGTGKPIITNTGASVTTAGDGCITLMYDASNNSNTGAWIVLNASL